MAEPTILLADAIVAELNGRNWPGVRFQALRTWLPKWKLPDLDELRVPVVPREKKADRFSRITDAEELGVEIGIQCRVKDISNATIDPLIDFSDTIETHLRRTMFTVDGQYAVWSETEFLVQAYPEHLLKNAFTTAFAMTFKRQRVHAA